MQEVKRAICINSVHDYTQLLIKGKIGPKIAKLILQQRPAQGYKEWSELAGKVAGLGPKRVQSLVDAGFMLGPSGAIDTPLAEIRMLCVEVQSDLVSSLKQRDRAKRIVAIERLLQQPSSLKSFPDTVETVAVGIDKESKLVIVLTRRAADAKHTFPFDQVVFREAGLRSTLFSLPIILSTSNCSFLGSPIALFEDTKQRDIVALAPASAEESLSTVDLFSFREEVSSKRDAVWEFRGQTDVYTGLTREIMVRHNIPQEVDHVIEIQMFQAAGASMQGSVWTRATTRAVRAIANDLSNLNVTSRAINQKKNGPTGVWLKTDQERSLADSVWAGTPAGRELSLHGTWGRIQVQGAASFEAMLKQAEEGEQNAVVQTFFHEALHDLLTRAGIL